MNKKTRPPFLNTNADTRVITKDASIIIVATSLVEANIFLTWLTGPIRNSVLKVKC